jgi:peptidoglycan biosynthesis protein MviN/MurJ (putative lipid II flippase)
MNLARSLGSVGGLTLASRILALVRDSLQAQQGEGGAGGQEPSETPSQA